MFLQVPHPDLLEGYKRLSLGLHSEEAAPKVQGAVLAYLRGTGCGPAPGYGAHEDHLVFRELLGAAEQNDDLAGLRVGPLAKALPRYADHEAAYELLRATVLATVRGDPVPAVGPASLVPLPRAFVGINRHGR